MLNQRTERRAQGADSNSMSEVVTKSLLVQRRTGTIGAIEYLKAHGVDGAVIQRVLGGKVMRAEDARTLLNLAEGTAA